MDQNVLRNVALVVLRLGAGTILFAHGLQKAFGAFGGAGLKATIEMVKGMGFTPPAFWGGMLAYTELLGGLFLIVGILPRFSAFSVAIVMMVAIIKVHGPHGFFAMNGGFEYPFLILMVSITLMLLGSGRYSLYNKL